MRFRPLRLALCATLLALPQLRADVSLPSLFSDHMVLQADKPAAIWGTAAPGEKVTINFLKKTYSAQADDKGQWKLNIAATPKGGPYELVAHGVSNEIRIQDVLVGEVWLCSGQSNMEMQIRGAEHGEVANADGEIAAANYPEIRMFFYTTTYSIYKLDVPPSEPQSTKEGHWVVCSPATAADFSAVGYFFGRELFKQVGGPVGLINSSVGGTPIEAWTSKEGQSSVPEIQPILEYWKTTLATYDPATEQQKAGVAKDAWLKQRAELTKQGQPIPKSPPPFKNLQVYKPTGLFNSMINPLIPYTIRGVIWYQGERNAAGPFTQLYGKQLETMIKDWRSKWNDDFYFGFMQIANFQKPTTAPSQDKGWGVWVRDGQRKTAGVVPKSGMAITIDLGGENAGHPTNKVEFAQRISSIVLHDVYGKGADAEYTGPLYQSSQREGTRMILTFTHADGLKANDGELQGFAIAGPDKKFVWAKAEVQNGKLAVWADGISEPASVRYDWAANPAGNLRNGAGFPASPFRTDDWENTALNSPPPKTAP